MSLRPVDPTVELSCVPTVTGEANVGQQFVGVPQPAGIFDDPGRLDIDTAARTLGRRREVRRAGDAIALRDDAGVLVGAGARAHGIADRLRLRCRDRPRRAGTRDENFPARSRSQGLAWR